jgi:hypothetical protein
LILTDLEAHDADVDWYGFRAWIECSYRDLKSDGWQWQKTRLEQPDRAERHWLAMSVALLWMITLGGEAELTSNEQPLPKHFNSVTAQPSLSSPPSARSLSCFLNGLLTIVAQLLNGQSLSIGRLFPLPLNHFPDLAFSNSS